MLNTEGLEVRHRLRARSGRGQPRGGFILHSGQSQLGQPSGKRPGELRVGDIREGRPAPQPQRFVQIGRGPRGICGERGAPRSDKSLEPDRVDGVGLDVKTVPGGVRLDRQSRQGPA
jgi:hypothetical protein